MIYYKKLKINKIISHEKNLKHRTRYKIFFCTNIFFEILFYYFIMSTFNNTQSDKLFGKCCHIESGDRCGCQRFIALENDEKNCEACYHHSSYHEDIKEINTNRLNNKPRIQTLDELYSPSYNNSNISSSQETGNSLLNQLLSGRALEEQSIANELSRSFTQNQNHLTTTSSSSGRLATNFDPFSGASNYRNSRSKKRKNMDNIKQTCITAIVLPNIGIELQTPMTSQPM